MAHFNQGYVLDKLGELERAVAAFRNATRLNPKIDRAWYEQRFLPTLDALRRLNVERLLLTHGEPVLHDGARALAATLARPPWIRPSTTR